jgi:hypothetical protein
MNVEKAMGQQLKRFFEQLQEEHGMIERMRVSMQCSFQCRQVKGIESGDQYGEFVVTRT